MNRHSTLKTNPDKQRAWQQRSRKPLATRTALKATKPMRKIGKGGKANLEANKRLRASPIADINYCEIGKLGWIEFYDCMGSWPLQNVHKHQRSHYKANPDLLSDITEVVKGCQVCHAKLDRRTEESKELTIKVFQALRGTETTTVPDTEGVF